MEFDVGTDMDRALLLVSNRLDRVADYPAEAGSPQLTTSGSEDRAIAWFNVIREPGNNTPIHHYGRFVEEVIKERLERVKGVGEVSVFGGSDPEIQIVVHPEELARLRLTVGEILQSLRNANVSLSVGDVDEGKRRYIVRSEGELKTVEEVRKIFVRSSTDVALGRPGRVRLSDIATVNLGHKDPTAVIRVLGEPSIPFNATRETGANVIETMAGIREVVADLNRTAIPGTGLILRQGL